MRHYSHDAWNSVSCTINLPAKGAVMGALAPVLTPSEAGERRSFLVAYPILQQTAADRRTANSEWAADLGEELRHKAKIKQRARSRNETAKARGVDAKLARGNALTRPYAVCTVTVPKTARIAEYGRRLDASVRRAGFAPLRLDLAHDVGVRRLHRPPRRQPDPPGSPHDRPYHAAASQSERAASGSGCGPAARRLRPRPARRTDPAATEAKEPRLFQLRPSRGGCRRRGRGWAAAKAPVSTWRMTSDQAPVLWPFISTPGLPPTGAQMGIDMLSGGSFYADPFGWVLDDTVPVTNPNMFVFGKPGRGKSATVKALLLRMMDFGYRALILGDPKDEYEKLCRALGVEPFAIGPGLPARINPLAFGPLGARLGPARRGRGAEPGRDRVRPLADPGPRAGRQPTPRRPAGPVRPHR